MLNADDNSSAHVNTFLRFNVSNLNVLEHQVDVKQKTEFSTDLLG